MEKQYLSEAFKQLDILEEEDFNLSATSAVDDIKGFLDNDDKKQYLDIIDPEAEDEEELEDSYIGKVIFDCCVCHSKIYKNAEDVHVDEETGLANEGEECPFCYTNDGFKIIGQVSPFEDSKVEDEVEVTVDDDVEDVEEDEDTDEMEEGLAGAAIGGIAGSLVGHPIAGAAVGNAIGNNLQKVIDKKIYDKEKNKSEALKSSNHERITKIEEKLRKKHKNESFERVEIETQDQTMRMTQEENGKVTVESEPKGKSNFEGGPEMVVPTEPEVEDEINANSGIEDELPDAKAEINLDMDDFDEESFDELGEGYLKRVYENVDSFKTSGVKQNGNNMTVEGVIKFNSGKEKKTSFVFESKDATKRGKVRFSGLNEQISKGKKSFTLTGTVKNSKLVCEALNYNYRAKGAKGNSTRVYGTVKRA